MTAEIWVVAVTLFLGTAAVAGVAALFQAGGRWAVLATWARAVGTVLVAIAMSLAVIAQGGWSPFEPRQVMVGLALSMLVIQMLLAWRLRAGSGGPVVDVLAVVLILVGTFLYQPDSPLLTCAQRAWPFQAQWILFQVGGGGVLVAGSAGLMLVVRTGLVRWPRYTGRPGRTERYSMLTEAIFLVLVAIGSGLVVSAWWAWRTTGSLTSGDPREAWMASAWVVGVMSLLAWQLEGHRGRWAAGLAVTATALVILSLLWLLRLQSLAGI